MYHRHHRALHKRQGLRAIDLALAVALVAGALMAARPIVDDLRSDGQSQEVISAMSSNADKTYDPERMRLLAQAQAYNRTLSQGLAQVDSVGLGGSNDGTADILDLGTQVADDEVIPYEEQLVWEGQSALCWVEIPCIGVRQPVYHGMTDESLAMGVGHLEGSALPVGGSVGNCVLAAHSGMPEASMFDELERLGTGDIVVLHTLGDAYCYEVTATEVLLPEQVDELCGTEVDGDQCTLVTCTPYGINSHRLVVHCSRCAYRRAEQAPTGSFVRHLESRRSRPLMAYGAACAALGLAAALLAHRRARLGR